MTAIQVTPVKWLRILAALTLVLIGLGSYVRATGAGLACPDWPLCFGRAVPEFTYGVAQEVIHRYLAGAVMLITLALTWRGFKTRAHDRVFFIYAFSLLILVTIQAIFGGLTVTMKLNPFVVTTHLALGTLFFQAVALGSFRSSYRTMAIGGSLRTVLLVLALITFLQILVGGFVGASGASLVCPNFPQCGVDGKMTGAQHLQLTHRVLGFALVFALGFAGYLARGLVGEERKKIYAGIMRTCGLVVTQVLVGWLNLVYLISSTVTVIHILLAQGILLHILMIWWRLGGKNQGSGAKLGASRVL